MKLKSIQNITNYRNLSDISLKFGNKVTYIVGENNLGKSNIFDMFNHVFKVRDFTEDDFKDTNNPISMNCFFEKDNDEEISFWGDHFCNGDIEVEYSHIYDEHLTSCIKGDPVHKLLRRNFCYIPIYSGIGLDKSIPNLLAKKGAVAYIFNKIESLISNEAEYINNESIESLKSSVQDELNQISVFQNISISYEVNDLASMLASMLFLVDKSGKHIDYSGEGLKRRLHIILYILSGIANHCENYKQHVEDLKNTPNALNIVVAIDEPELHLHPHWQRQIINEIILLTENSIIEELKISFQIIIVTHSPYMIQGSEYAINRLFLSNQQSNSVSTNISSQSTDMKEIHDRYIDQLREAYFAKGVLLVEGESDQGVLEAYNIKNDYILDKYSISIVNIRGADNTPEVHQWFKRLDIPVVAIIDKDKENTKWCRQIQTNAPNDIVISNGIDLEESIYDLIVQHQNKKEIFNEFISNKIVSELNNSFQMSGDYKKACKIVFGSEVDLTQKEKEFKSNTSLNDIFTGSKDDNDIHKVLWLSKLKNIKSMYEGSLVGKILCNNSIFPQYLVDGINQLIQQIEEQENVD